MLAAEDREFLGTIVRSMLGRLLELIGLMHGQPVPTSDASYLAKPHVRRKLDRLVAITWLQGRLDSMLVAEGRAARRFGASYADIGLATGLSKQRAHQKFRIPETPGNTEPGRGFAVLPTSAGKR